MAQERDTLALDSLEVDTTAETLLTGTLQERLQRLLADELLQRTQVGIYV